MSNPRISIVTINWNNKIGLEKTCCSVANQTVKPYEWIIIDGGSSDGSVDVIKRYADYISYWVSEPDKGIYNAMNKGVDKVTGDYVQFLNSGDEFFDADSLGRVYSYLSNHRDLDFLVGNTKFCNPSFSYIIIPPQTISGKYLFLESLPHPSTFVRAGFLKKHPFREDFRIASDWIFSLQVLLFENAVYGVIDSLVSVFDGTGVSTKNFWSAQDERKRAWIMLFGERIFNDYKQMIYGQTTLEKIVCRIGKYKFLNGLLTIFALPIFALYKIIPKN